MSWWGNLSWWLSNWWIWRSCNLLDWGWWGYNWCLWFSNWLYWLSLFLNLSLSWCLNWSFSSFCNFNLLCSRSSWLSFLLRSSWLYSNFSLTKWNLVLFFFLFLFLFLNLFMIFLLSKTLHLIIKRHLIEMWFHVVLLLFVTSLNQVFKRIAAWLFLLSKLL